MDLETVQSMKKELELALINLQEGASDEKRSGMAGVAYVLGMLKVVEGNFIKRDGITFKKLLDNQNESC